MALNVLDDEPKDKPWQAPDIAEFETAAEDAGARLDLFLTARMEHSRSQIQDWIEGGRVLLDGRPARASAKLKAGQVVLVEKPPLELAEPQPEEGIPIQVVYEDKHLLVLDKSRGLTIHPGAGAPSGTLVNALLAYCKDLSGVRGIQRPGIVHRLDKDTSGLIVVAKDDRAHNGLSAQFEERSVLKIYRAITHGVPAPAGTIDQPIGRHRLHRTKMSVRTGGRDARTDWEVVEAYGRDYALLDLHLHSGRTHQIRVHMTWLGFPLVGDTVYGRKSNPWGLQGQALHCRKLGFHHPVLQKPMEFEAPLPQVLQDIVDDLRRGYCATLEER